MREPDRYFAFLLKLLPAAFRTRHGQELRALVNQMKDDLGPSPSKLSLLRLYSGVTWDLLRQSPLLSQVSAPGARTERGWMGMERPNVWWSILREGFEPAVRTVRRYPGFTAAVVITLGLGIGANATMYGIVDRLLLQPPAHVVEHERVRRVAVETLSFFGTGELVMRPLITFGDYEDLKSHEGFSAVAVFTDADERTIGSGESATRAQVALASAEFFPLLGVAPIRGRFYTAEESTRGSVLPAVAVLSAEYWTSVYGANPDVLGRTVEVEGFGYTIVGVAPAGFTGVDLGKVDFWLPLRVGSTVRGYAGRAVIRVKDGVSIEAAEAEANRLVLNGWRGVEARGKPVRLVLWPLITGRGPGADFDPGERGLENTAESRVAVWLAGVSVIVLLIACANVANLLMARGTRQRREVAVRIALGASRGRVVGQMMVESVLLALAGGLLAFILARWGGDIVRSMVLPDVYFPDSGLAGRLLGFTAIAALVAGVTAGIGPALQASRADITGFLGDGSRGSSARRSKFRMFLTIAQAAMSVVLLVGAGLFVRSLGEARSVDLGLDVDRLLLARLDTRMSVRSVAESRPRYLEERVFEEEWFALHEEAIRRLSALPGVRSAAAARVLFQGSSNPGRFSIPGIDSIAQVPGGQYQQWVSPGYFETLGVAIIRGRPFEASDRTNDRAEVPRVAVVSETMARVLWPDSDALGGCLLLEMQDGVRAEGCTTIVGVAEDVARGGFQDVPGFTYYLPQPPNSRLVYRGIYVRAEGEAGSIIAEVTALLRSFSPEVWYADVRTLESMLEPEARAWTLGVTIFTLFGLLALCLAAIGLYSMLAFDVAQRTRELGIRQALGATKSRLLRSVLCQGAGLALLGVGLGLGTAYFAAPYANDLLFEVPPRDPWVFAGVALALIAVSGVASLVPGLRATRADTIEALRAE